MKERPYYNEVAETFEEILQAVEGGQTDGHLRPREKKMDLKSIMNKAKLDKIQKEKNEEAERLRKEQIRKKRDNYIKNNIKETKDQPESKE